MADLSLRADSARINPIAIFGRAAVEAEVERLIALLDQADGDNDLEDDDPIEEIGDERDLSWTEWHTRGRHKGDCGIYDANGFDVHEDAELNGDEDDGDHAEDEACARFGYVGRYFEGFVGGFLIKDIAGCPVADPGGCEHDGSEPEEPILAGDAWLCRILADG